MTVTELSTPWDRVRVHWSAPTWLRTIHVATGLPITLAGGFVIGGLAVVSVTFSWTVVAPLAGLPLLFMFAQVFTGLQRRRFAAYLGVEIPPVLRPAERNPLKRLVRDARSKAVWRQVAYHVIAPVIGVAGFFAVVVAWAACLVAGVLAVRTWAEGASGWPGLLLVLLAFGLFVVVPWVVQGVTTLDVMVAEALLGPSVNEQLVQRVETLQESRAEVVEAADAERRRIERDLHDGTQQRLLGLAMNLGMARAALTDVPESAREVIAQAHEESKLILKELRDVVRGIHPAVLSEQGLDAALSGLATRAPFPVRLSVDVTERATPTVEAVAFFVVSEALTNVAKHAEATGAELTVGREGDRLRIIVRDDGRGGAAPGAAGGTGLRGLVQRVGSVDGTLRIDSPPGGPTTIEAELPCA
ncbi:histidine kinase [Planotetraspora thailandica]|uniref:histidine kinase n=1 Tax=Planotetraspora thailandica TaxID=487172 RepID=A0A8J3Y0W4_9ACTN|nr:sensor domain-containing protein [Planotetraspora thailandica]GII58722.1 histidine kinase [Planotetraspora thailandica]